MSVKRYPLLYATSFIQQGVNQLHTSNQQHKRTLVQCLLKKILFHTACYRMSSVTPSGFIMHFVQLSVFDVMLTVHLSTILVTDQPNEKNSCFIISLLQSSTCFEHYCVHHQEVKIVLYSIWYHHTLQVGVRYAVRTGRPPTECNDTRFCIIQF